MLHARPSLHGIDSLERFGGLEKFLVLVQSTAGTVLNCCSFVVVQRSKFARAHRNYSVYQYQPLVAVFVGHYCSSSACVTAGRWAGCYDIILRWREGGTIVHSCLFIGLEIYLVPAEQRVGVARDISH